MAFHIFLRHSNKQSPQSESLSEPLVRPLVRLTTIYLPIRTLQFTLWTWVNANNSLVRFFNLSLLYLFCSRYLASSILVFFFLLIAFSFFVIIKSSNESLNSIQLSTNLAAYVIVDNDTSNSRLSLSQGDLRLSISVTKHVISLSLSN